MIGYRYVSVTYAVTVCMFLQQDVAKSKSSDTILID